MPTPSKPISVIKAEGNKAHKTKAQIKLREKAEKALATEESFQEWDQVKKNPTAHKEFTRLKRLFAKIKKDDSLLEGVLNRYCIMLAECDEYEARKESLAGDLEELYDSNMEIGDKIKAKININKMIMACDSKIMQKRTMMLAIEKENIMTIASQLRSIPKKIEDPGDVDPMESFLRIVK
jgi:hypothetical protein